MTEDTKELARMIEGSAREHGHLCAGQIIGVRMALLGLKLIGLPNAKNTRDIKKLLVYVEIDRCATDAISYVTGARLGRRSLKFKDYGIMAATFVNTEIGRAFRIISTERSRKLAHRHAPEETDPSHIQLVAYRQMTLHELFEVYEVRVDVPESDYPGPTRFKAVCAMCGTVVRDGRESIHRGKTLCHYCSGDTYYKHPLKISLPGQV